MRDPQSAEDKHRMCAARVWTRPDGYHDEASRPELAEGPAFAGRPESKKLVREFMQKMSQLARASDWLPLLEGLVKSIVQLQLPVCPSSDRKSVV